MCNTKCDKKFDKKDSNVQANIEGHDIMVIVFIPFLHILLSSLLLYRLSERTRAILMMIWLKSTVRWLCIQHTVDKSMSELATYSGVITREIPYL